MHLEIIRFFAHLFSKRERVIFHLEIKSYKVTLVCNVLPTFKALRLSVLMVIERKEPLILITIGRCIISESFICVNRCGVVYQRRVQGQRVRCVCLVIPGYFKGHTMTDARQHVQPTMETDISPILQWWIKLQTWMLLKYAWYALPPIYIPQCVHF